MTTIEINERTKAGKALLELARFFSKEQKGVKIIEPGKKEEQKEKYPSISQDKLKSHVLKTFEETDKGIGLSKPQDIDDFLKEIETW